MPTLEIYISGNYTADDFERVQKSNSREISRHERVVISLKSISWCDPYALSLLLLWLKRLKNRSKDVHLSLPASTQTRPQTDEHREQISQEQEKDEVVARVYAFFIQTRFIEILDKFDISHDPIDLTLSKVPPNPIYSWVSPFISFADWNDLKSFLVTLRSVEQMRLFFEDAHRYGIVKSGKIRDIIMRELGDNIFEHAEGNSGHLVMNRSASSAWGIPPWEETFFRTLHGQPYLEIVISDGGPGIFKTLSERYIKDFGSKIQDLPLSNSQVVEYAFLQYSTKKTLEERLKKLLDVLRNTNQMDAIPATGLYWVKETCREFNALLCVRSGDSILTYDFLSNPLQNRPKVTEQIKVGARKVKLEKLDGVQLKMCFPLIEGGSERHINPSTESQSLGRPRMYRLLSVSSFFQGIDPDDLNSLAAPLLEIIDRIQRIKLENESAKIIVVNFEDSYMANKALFILVVELMRMQDADHTLVAINAEALINLREQVAEFSLQQKTNEVGALKEKPLASFNSDWDLFLLGLDEELEHTIIESIQPRREGTSLPGSLHPSSDARHLIEVVDGGSKYSWTFSLIKIQQLAAESLRDSLRELISTAEGEDRIFHPSQWFLISSAAYCFGFFELGKLFSRVGPRSKLARWLTLRLSELKPDVLITVGIGSESLAALIPDGSIRYQRIDIVDPENPSYWFKLALLEKRTRVVIFTDVIGTGKTIKSVIEKLPLADVSRILTIVDARQDTSLLANQIKIEGREYELESILRFPIQFEHNLPERCTYSDIVLIDPVSHAPIWESAETQAPLWSNFDEFLDQVIRETNSVATGHFESTDKHILYLFLTPLIVRKFGEQIVNKIRLDIEQLYAKIPQAPHISTVFYPDKSPGTELIADKLCSAFLGSRPFAITSKILANPLSYPWREDYRIDDAVIFDDAASSGTTVKQMIDIVEKWGAKRIFIYVLFNRCDEYEARLLEKIKRYGGAVVEVRFLTNVKIPAYDVATCPVCKTIGELKQARESAAEIKSPQNNVVVQYIDSKISQLKPQPIQLIFNPTAQHPFLATDIDRRISRCKLRRLLELAITDPEARNALSSLFKENKRESVLLFFQVLAKEKHAFYPTDPKRNDLFYPTFRENIIETARRFYSYPLELHPKEFDAVISVVRMFDEDIFLADLETIIREIRDSNTHIMVVLTHLLTSNKAQRQPEKVLQILTGGESDFVPEQLNLFQWVVEVSQEARSENIRTPELFKELLWELSPSWGPDPKFNYLHFGLKSYLLGELSFTELRESLRIYWDEIVKRLRDEILLKLNSLREQIKSKNLSLSVSNDLALQLKEINSILQWTDDLRTQIFEESSEYESINSVVEAFDTSTERLQFLLCSDELGTIHDSLVRMTTEIRTLVNNIVVFPKIQAIFELYEISCVVSVPDEACFVFGHASELVIAVQNLAENLMHAFEHDTDSNRMVIFQIERRVDKISFIIRDTGDAVFPVKPGIGLQKVDSIISSLGGTFTYPKKIEIGPYKTEVGFELELVPEVLMGL